MTDQPINPDQSESAEQHRPRPGEGPVEGSAEGPAEGYYPPPTPPPGYVYPMIPPAPKRSMMKTVLRFFFSVTSLVGVLLVGLVIGFYGGILSLAAESGPVSELVWQQGNKHEKIVIIPVMGFIGTDSAAFMHNAVEAVLADNDVAGVIIRVESGGGMIGPSEQMWYELMRLREIEIPIVGSFGSIAASGGYYVSCMSDYIFAEPTCITGSIGVMAQVMTLEQTMAKLGIEPVILTATKSGKKDVANNMFRQWTEEDIKSMTYILDSMHERFLTVVREGRGETMNEKEIEAVSTGEVYTVDQAMEVKLIDEIGYLHDAVAMLTSKLELYNPQVVMYGVREGLLGKLGVEYKGNGLAGLPAMDAQGLRKTLMELGTVQIMYYYNP